MKELELELRKVVLELGAARKLRGQYRYQLRMRSKTESEREHLKKVLEENAATIEELGQQRRGLAQTLLVKRPSKKGRARPARRW
jgi:hypothetical protein